MKNIGIILVLLSLFSCETKYNYIDSGLANGRFDGTMYDYLHSNSTIGIVRYSWWNVPVWKICFKGNRPGTRK